MAKKKAKITLDDDEDRKGSFGGYGLKSGEDEELTKLLKDHDLSAKKVVRALLRQWMKEGGHGVLRYSTK